MAFKKNTCKEAVKHLLILFVMGFTFFPLYLMVVTSLKDNKQFIQNPWFFDGIGSWHWENWAKAWSMVQYYIANSVVTSVGAVSLCLVMSIMSSYIIARYRFPGKNVFYYGLIGSMFLPSTAATLVTTFTLLQKLHLINTLWALVLLGAVGGQAVCIFILKNFIEELPPELFEAAQLDGANHIQQIFNIVLPMIAPVLGTLAILQFLVNWNDLILPLVVLRDDHLLTIPVGLMRLEGEYVKQWGELMAGYTISSIPLVILFLLTMRLFVKGLTAGAIKG